jgi:NADPH:quinone reductase-like Zn-dependent oxidoreductase
MGATVVATSSSDKKLERVKALGADFTINYKSDPEWGATVRRLTGGQGVDHVVETGGPGTLSQSIVAVRTAGRIALIGTLTRQNGDLPLSLMMIKNARLQGILVGSRRQQQDMVRGIEASGLKPVVDRRFGLDGLADAFRYEESGQHLGKICLEF